MNIQPLLENNHYQLIPLKDTDFELLYEVASDPKIWEQHPNKDRWKKEVFKVFFEGAMASRGAFKIMDKLTNEVVGSTRFYDYNKEDNSIFIGYTFYATKVWGKGANPSIKKLMLDYILPEVDLVKFHVGKNNARSKVAMERLGAKPVKEIEVAYFGEQPKINIEYHITKKDW